MSNSSIRSLFEVKNIERVLFSNGYNFLVTYLVVYLSSWAFGISTTTSVLITTSLHLIVLSLFANFVCSRISSLSFFNVAFWLFLFFFFFIPGAYLEYPSDPWEHLRRILNWQSIENVQDSDLLFKSWYFFAWSLLSWFPMELWRWLLSVLSSLTQMLLAYQVFRLSQALGFDKKLAYLQTICFFLFFGTDIYGFRYYALSSSTFGFIAYFGLITTFLNLANRKLTFSFATISQIAISLFIISFNHLQELLFALSSAFFILTTFFICKYQFSIRKIAPLGIVVILVLTYLIGFAAVNFYPSLYSGFGIRKITEFGTAKFWADSWRVMSTVGVHGWLGLMCALVFYRKLPYLAILTIAPFLYLILHPLFSY